MFNFYVGFGLIASGIWHLGISAKEIGNNMGYARYEFIVGLFMFLTAALNFQCYIER